MSDRLDVVELGALKRLGKGPRWDDAVSNEDRTTILRLCGKGLAESVKIDPTRHKRGGVFFRITNQGMAEL